MSIRVILTCCAALLAPGCRKAEAPAPEPAKEGSAHRAPAGEAPPVHPATAVPAGTIRGRASFRERIAVPPGSVLTVQLVTLTARGEEGDVLATTSVPGREGPPYAFTLSYDPARLPEVAGVGLVASLNDAEGERWFATGSPVPFAPGSGEAPALDLVRATPEARARARGVVFRAVGQEPGWVVEVGSGSAPRLHAELDYGERQIDVAAAEPTPDGFRARIAKGIPLVLHIKREPCEDPMSGEVSPASATLTVGDDTYRGCGRFLAD